MVSLRKKVVLFPKLLLGNPILSSSACLLGKAELSRSRSQAGDIIVIHKSRQPKNSVIPAWMPESSAMDGNLSLAQVLDSGKLPAPRFTSL